MREQERKLSNGIEHCLSKTQEYVDMESAKAISIFSSKVNSNGRWLAEISGKYELKESGELEAFRLLKEDHVKMLDQLEGKIEYYEKLLDELTEFTSEIEIKRKIEKNRRSRHFNNV
ncbi:hypothetical protein Kpol_1056p2 [Vanderwaltozyma polyspora DSM 70294]|uniref:Biogenesis of lysosome-related organelles complex 1 subunit BLI1 n=1 Tax=Vanderwaltozyma polyspora (strain ATCC 22028 / DSM 70294 / BCRC 21397 / CBS 2163 / NBRC 10782 / NRRL Y-8283 / UCD 57-17) TaxID=436907 RepID=BLI1_VANPO|nr:uncharacterized protein Kpol_1056p2 [Vanderwaltozyma polyspora DSM 70294]A7TLL0.1 RecName: Full=Biogenesis of lysosome-related organelles complex 1 subunit BLI1; Short=BLOC-1 subunit BLI1; AltName: Full=BLOC-1 interactor 1 [Vanderwaltozyma polyspora DSM 70294]EDO16802.1 hypothetical protein Kpol_1056p2 [Vanderwaltozyma polyspora DSM 70294]